MDYGVPWSPSEQKRESRLVFLGTVGVMLAAGGFYALLIYKFRKPGVNQGEDLGFLEDNFTYDLKKRRPID